MDPKVQEEGQFALKTSEGQRQHWIPIRATSRHQQASNFERAHTLHGEIFLSIRRRELWRPKVYPYIFELTIPPFGMLHSRISFLQTVVRKARLYTMLRDYNDLAIQFSHRSELEANPSMPKTLSRAAFMISRARLQELDATGGV